MMTGATMVVMGVVLAAILQSNTKVLERIGLGGLAFASVVALGAALWRHAMPNSYSDQGSQEAMFLLVAVAGFAILSGRFHRAPRE
jgi:hypothetical protein